MSAYEVTPDWQSPRKKKELEAQRLKKLEDDKLEYVRKRFESYYQMEERGELTRALAHSALREEIAYAKELDDLDECPTISIDTNALKDMLDE